MFSKFFFQRPKVMDIAIAGKSFPYPNPPKRIFQTVYLKGDEFDSSKMQYFRTLIVEIYKRKDTIYGVQVYYDTKTEYQHIVKAFDLCHIFDMRHYSIDLEKNIFWACYKLPKIYRPYDGDTHLCGCGGCYVTRQLSFKEKFTSQSKDFYYFFKDFHNKEGRFDSEFSHTIHNN